MLTVSDVDLGTPESVWSSSPVLHGLAPLALVAGRPLVVVAPHPDDEILGAAGLMLAAHDLGADIMVVAVTDGEASHPGTSWTGARLAARRRAESREALDRLGLAGTEVVRLGVPDGGVAAYEQRLRDRLRELVPGDAYVATTWRGDGHPDHEATGRATAGAAAATGATLIEHPIWAWHWATPASGLPFEQAVRLDLDEDVRLAKVGAIAAFTSQIAPMGPRPEEAAILPPAVRARFERPFEVHLRTAAT
jgi:LmbE family N-acetylglucosaminyl deacetylase